MVVSRARIPTRTAVMMTSIHLLQNPRRRRGHGGPPTDACIRVVA